MNNKKKLIRQAKASDIFKYCRKYLRLNQKMMSFILGCNHTQLSKIENGRRFPTATQIVNLESLMNKSFEQLKTEVTKIIFK